ncbi:MAG: ferritin-like domain-containing protein [Actinomycetota bacterium]|nr:ferritin-like domain-containing protein [Actinomycetota bacterium]
MEYDERALGELIERSEDVHADAMRAGREQLADLVELGLESRSRDGAGAGPAASPTTDSTRRPSGAAAGATAAAGIAAGVLLLLESAAAAGTPGDVAILQTAAALENLAVATYGVALTLPFIGGATANGVVKAFVTTTRRQHAEHADAFNAAVEALHGRRQTAPDPVLARVVARATPTLRSATKVVELAIELETVASETYVRDAAQLRDRHAKALTASVMGVEAQHVAVLLAVRALLAGGAASDIALPPPLATLPAAAGRVGFPNAFYSTTAARPATEGAVR